MATVERSAPTAMQVAPAPSERRKLVGRIGPWQLIRLLNEGNLTRVYLARPADASPSQPVAYVLKLLRKEWWQDRVAIETQRREAWISTRLAHPHILPVLSAHVDQPPFYLVLPRLHGETVAEALAGGRRPSLPLALWIARQTAEGLAALHETTGMIHADVKPSNIFVSPEGHATLLDFGFAQTQSEARSWANRPVVGTLAYIAPEMVTSACAVDPRTDIYSLGVTLYEMLTGRKPLHANDPTQWATVHRQEKPHCIRSLRPEIPKPVATLVHLMLAKDPLRRPGDAREVVERLVRLEIECFGHR